MTERLHILLVNSSMGCGGAERVISILANYWVSVGTQITILTTSTKDRDHYKLDRRVARRSLDADRKSKNFLDGIMNNLQRIRRLRNAANVLHPSVIISFQDKNNVLSLLATVGLSIPVVISERNDPKMRPIPPIWGRLRHIVYRWASALIVQNHALKEWGESIVEAEKVHVLPNPVICPKATTRSKVCRQEFVVAAGRLVKQKGFDVLLQAIAQCAVDWPLTIVGEGPERANLEKHAQQLEIANQVSFIGQIDDLGDVFHEASLFVLASRYEGFPNVLVEAMALGLPVISFDCSSGPAEIISHGVNGLLVPPGDVTGLALAIDELMLDPDKRLLLAGRAPEVIERFSIEEIMSKWNSVVSKVCQVDG